MARLGEFSLVIGLNPSNSNNTYLSAKVTLKFTTTILLLMALSSKAFTQPFGGFVKFDGHKDALYMKASDLFPAESDYTIEFWFKPCLDTGLVYEALAGNGEDLEVNYFKSANDSILFYQRCARESNGAYECSQDHQYAADEEWHHMAITYDFVLSRFEYYFDGIDGTSTINYDYEPQFLDTFFFGRGNRETWLWDHFDGSMDEIRVSDNIRYSSSFNPDTIPFVSDSNTYALWHLDDSVSLSNVFDASGNGRHLSVIHHPHILWPNNSYLKYADNISSGHGRSKRSQPFSKCPIIPNEFDVFILGESDTSGGSIDTTDTTLSVPSDGWNGLTMSRDIRITPNPCLAIINIEYNPIQSGEYYIIDINGRRLLNGDLETNGTTVVLHQLDPGLYILRAVDSVGTTQIKFIKQ